ncbi:hypothetical protein DAPPUDRAFT_328859 [Daphnia pulex]|uniref:Uncharacterized protein n=1 Tax=Daphnia pulex TaxID=6669 RepID=E9HEZ2_DAPPU|nr:hypothetical protein DAPPUDRAFT_328859 [Daphnia pulex]|eukprot:EFX69699.1 hypothetical protein DAPPUDRAFT_328859 [Daphnia pulex]
MEVIWLRRSNIKAYHAKQVIDSVAKNSIDRDKETGLNLFSEMSDVEVDFPETANEDFSGVSAQNIFSSPSTSDDIDSVDNDDNNTNIEIENDHEEFWHFEIQETKQLQAIFPRVNGESNYGTVVTTILSLTQTYFTYFNFCQMQNN